MPFAFTVSAFSAARLGCLLLHRPRQAASLPRLLLLYYTTLRYYYHSYRGDTSRLVVGANRGCRAHAIALAPFSAVASLRRADKRPSVKEPRVGPATQKP